MRRVSFPIDGQQFRLAHKQARSYAVSLCIYVLLLGIALIASWGAIWLVDGTRAYVTGESCWSKAEKTAVVSLHKYAYSEAQNDYQAFVAATTVPLADHIGRLALERSPPDLVTAHYQFVRGENREEDIPSLITLFRRFSWWQPFAASLDIWRQGDQLLFKMLATARELHSATISGHGTLAIRRRFLDRIDSIDSQLTVLENRFSVQLGIASRAATLLVIVALSGMTVVLWALGTAFAAVQIRRQIALDLQLSSSERRFRDYAELASDGYWEMNPEGRLTYISDRLSDMLRIPTERLLDSTAHDYICDHAVSTEHRNNYLAARAERRPFRGIQVEIRTQKMDVRYWSIAGKPLFDEDGAFLGYRGIGSDITAAVLDGRALIEAKERAEAANRAKSAFLANMSHELRTPLNAILGFADMIRQKVLGQNAVEQYSTYASHIHEAGEHLLGIINDILDLSRIEAGRSELSNDEIALESLAQSMRILLNQRFQESGTAFDIDLPDPAPRIVVDERKFGQILINLLSNALKFTPSGGRVVLAAVMREDNGLDISVKDTGIGIAAEDIPVVLSPFGQVESPLSRKHHGTGLGLPLAKSLAELHGGSLHLRSTPHVGTMVTVHLPPQRVRPHQAAAATLRNVS